MISSLSVFHPDDGHHQEGVTIGLEVLLPKEAKLHASEAGPPLQYDVFLYKVANNGDSASPGKAPPPQSHNSYNPQVPKSPKTPKHSQEHSPRGHDPWCVRHTSPGRQTSPGRHVSPGHHPFPSHHSSSYYSPSHFRRGPVPCSTSLTPPQIRRPRGRSQASVSECCPADCHRSHMRPSPSSPHLTQPPASPSRVKCSPASTRSLPPLS